MKTMPMKFQGFSVNGFDGLDKDGYFLKSPKWQHER